MKFYPIPLVNNASHWDMYCYTWYIYLVYIHYILPICEWVDRGSIWIQTVELCQYCLSFIVWWLLLARGLFPFINALFTLLVLLFPSCPVACISACSGPRSWIFFCSHILIITFSMIMLSDIDPAISCVKQLSFLLIAIRQKRWIWDKFWMLLVLDRFRKYLFSSQFVTAFISNLWKGSLCFSI